MVTYVFIYFDTYVAIFVSVSTIFVVAIMNHPVYKSVVVHWTCPNDV